MDEKLFWLGFSVFPGIGPKKFKILLETFGNAKDAWLAGESELNNIIGKALTEKFIKFRTRTSLEEYAEKIYKSKVVFFTWNEEEYPGLLKELVDPPIVLYCKVETQHIASLQSNETIAIVGTRKITSYGTDVTAKITELLVAAGYTIVSGLAFGVDAVAHVTTIENKGKTIAVLGCGIDCPSPREHTKLYNQIIASGGVVVSEYPFSEPPSKGSFPSRNRIIAGLSRAVVVTEGSADSGALYTAKDAFTLGRPVFAVPGPITSSLSKGPHSLIEKGAKMVTGVDEIVKSIMGSNYMPADRQGTTGITGMKKIKGDTEEEQRIIDLLLNEGLLFDEIVKQTGIEPATMGAILSLMEMKGVVKTSDGGLFYLVI
jgi:DNA processing protein